MAALLAAALLAAPAWAQQRATNVPPPPDPPPGAQAVTAGKVLGYVGKAAGSVGKIQDSSGNAANRAGDSLLDFSGESTRGDGSIADGARNKSLGKLVGAGGKAVSAEGHAINAVDAYYRDDTPVMIDEASRGVENAGGAVGTYVPGVTGVSKVAGAGGRAYAAAERGDVYAATAAGSEAIAYGASCAAGWMGGGGPKGCDIGVGRAAKAIEYGNRAVGYAIDRHFEAVDQQIQDGDGGFAAMRARHAEAAEQHAAVNEADAREAAEQEEAAADASARADADARAAEDNREAAEQAAQTWSNIAAAATPRAAPRTEAPAAAPTGCHPGHDEAAHPGGCHQAPISGASR